MLGPAGNVGLSEPQLIYLALQQSPYKGGRVEVLKGYKCYSGFAALLTECMARMCAHQPAVGASALQSLTHHLCPVAALALVQALRSGRAWSSHCVVLPAHAPQEAELEA